MWNISLPVSTRKRMQIPNKFISTYSRYDFNIRKGFSSFSHCSDVLTFCMPGRGVGRLSAHYTFCPPSLVKHVFLHEEFSKMAHPTLTTSFSLRAFILVCKVKYLYLLILKDFFPSTHPFIHSKIFIVHLLCAWHSCRHEG